MNTLEMVLGLERDSVKFYTEAARRTKYPVGKKMFETVNEDEKRHLEMASQIIEGLHVTTKDVSHLKKNFKSVFGSMQNEMMRKVEVSVDDLEAFKIAMQMEKEGVGFYRKILVKARSEKEKALLERLIQEEEEHYDVFSNTYQFLANTGSWFLWEELAIVDGGTPWA
jgi:rubrerythrin